MKCNNIINHEGEVWVCEKEKGHKLSHTCYKVRENGLKTKITWRF